MVSRIRNVNVICRTRDVTDGTEEHHQNYVRTFETG
jgi:hypothetical protein